MSTPISKNYNPPTASSHSSLHSERAPIQNISQIKILERFSKFFIYFLIFLLPIFFLPWTSNILDFQKQALLLTFSFLALIFWLAKTLISGKIEINVSLINLPVIILLFVLAISTFRSLWPYGSFWGWPQTISASLLSFLGFAVFYFLTSSLFQKKEVFFLFLTFFLSGTLTVLISIFHLFGKFIFPLDFTKISSFNTIGTVNNLAIFSAILFALVLAFLFFARGFFKVIVVILGLILLVSLFLINFKIAWILLLIEMAVLFSFGVINLRKFGGSGFLTLAMCFLIISLFFIFFRFSLPGLPSTPQEVSPSQKAEIEILSQLPKNSLIFGTGPGTFIYNWSKYKTADLNQTIFWATRFGSGASEILDRLITTGILGILAFFLTFFFFGKVIYQIIVEKMKEKNVLLNEVSLPLGMIASFSGLVAMFFLYPSNLSMWFLFWLLIGGVAILGEKRKVFILETFSLKSLGLIFLLLIFLISGIGLLAMYGQKYFAEVRYSQGLQAFNRGDNLLAERYFLSAVNFNPQMDLYWRDLSQLYLIELNEVLQNQKLSQEERTSQSQSLMLNSINASNQTTNLNKADVANWNARGFIYRNLIGMVSGADEWAIKSYEEASKLEKTNPYIFTELGRVYLAEADLLAQQEGKEKDMQSDLDKARENFDKAVSLKSDYAPAHFQLAMIDVREGKTKEAISKLEETKLVAPLDTGLAFQLGLLYYNDNQLEKAKGELEWAINQAVSQGGEYANARYILGLVYDKEGEREKAIEQFEKIEKTSPGGRNEEVGKILANLRAKKPALEGIVSGQPPIEENPPEQLKK